MIYICKTHNLVSKIISARGDQGPLGNRPNWDIDFDPMDHWDIFCAFVKMNILPVVYDIFTNNSNLSHPFDKLSGSFYAKVCVLAPKIKVQKVSHCPGLPYISKTPLICKTSKTPELSAWLLPDDFHSGTRR